MTTFPAGHGSYETPLGSFNTEEEAIAACERSDLDWRNCITYKPASPVRSAPRMQASTSSVGGIGKGRVEVSSGFVVRWKNAKGETLGRVFSNKQAADNAVNNLRIRGGWDGPVSAIEVVPEAAPRTPGSIPSSIGQ